MARTRSLSRTDGSGNGTRATNIYDSLRGDLLSGELKPGSKLAIESLSNRYCTSATPLREALNRLVSEGLVERKELRGFTVAEISIKHLKETTQARCWLEEIALRGSIAARTKEWENDVVLSFHHLSRTPRSLNEKEFESNPDWEVHHRAFHKALISGVGSRWITGFCEILADQHHRYRMLSAIEGFSGRRDVMSEHEQIMEASLSGKADEAVILLHAHIRRTEVIVLNNSNLFS